MTNVYKSFIILALGIAFAGRTEARLGDDEAEIRAQYGDPIARLTAKTRDPGAVKCYFWKGYVVAVTYLGGRSVREIFTKANNSHLTGAEIESVLKANAGGLKWQEEKMNPPTSGVRQWRTSENSGRVAFYDSQTRALFLATERFVSLVNTTRRQIPLQRGGTVLGPAGTHGIGDAGMGALKSATSVLDKSAIMGRPGQAKPSGSPSN